MICELCNKEFFEKYSKESSGRFCSKHCARIFSTKNKRNEINEKVSKTIKEKYKLNLPKWRTETKYCKKCNKIFIPDNKNRIFCSKKCSLDNMRGKISKEGIKFYLRKKRLSESLQKQYQKGRKIYGGITKWYDYKNIRVQGTYELRTCKILDKLKGIGKIKDWEYTKDRFEYTGIDNKKHNYLLDFKIINNDNSFYYIEVKGYKTEIDELKWKAVRNSGNILEVWYEEQIKQQEKNLLLS